MKLVLYVHRAEHSDIQANCHSFLASKFVLEIYEHFNNIRQLHYEMPISSSFRKFPPYTWFHNLQILQQSPLQSCRSFHSHVNAESDTTDAMLFKWFSSQINSKNLIFSVWSLGVQLAVGNGGTEEYVIDMHQLRVKTMLCTLHFVLFFISYNL
jgi:hypothetical protein